MDSFQSHKDNCFSSDRRAAESKRQKTRRTEVVDRRLGLNRRRGPGRRRTEDRKAAEEGQMTNEQFDFLMAVDQYKKLNNRPFPTWTEVLELIKALGYRRVAEPCSINHLQEQQAVEANN